MQDYGELALAIATERNLDTEEKIFRQQPEFNATNLFVERDEDILIWEKLIEGDKLALGKLYDRYINILFSYGMYHSKDKSYVLDCIHDLFVDLFKYRSNLSKTDNVKYYLFKCLKRKINKKYRTKNVSVSLEDFQSKPDFTRKNHTNSCEKSIIKEEHSSERNAKLANALKTLTDKQRKILFLRFNEEKTYEEIAVIMEISIQTARTSIYRAIKTLRKLDF
ncbi:sigma-70 family RNA polymerase sigma factor [Cellulophaga baltica]|uniref:RNA polymerase sigma factor n=1 Tax=Cellulophaga TaxID=104264 RepID=UPI001C07267A|nr:MULTISPECIES: sigma-70 family RNA polymerase sigma factor [Cellulophaga]MBU2995854.1 sigma-70 family RNA polymerase sigma factor [Cellulophaga baltica]MDO6767249.1 sigma-70 family RNA polymerase sigma factor [Cellulophaga sp. 1_MG-2023]